jgi:hypothetical protein
MRVCDLCRDGDKDVGDYRVSIGKYPTGEGARATVRTLCTAKTELCEGCVEKLWERVAAVVTEISNRTNKTGA